MSSMPESIWLHKDEKYNTGDFGIWYDADFSDKVKKEGIENYVEYVPKYRMDEAIRKTKLTSED